MTESLTVECAVYFIRMALVPMSSLETEIAAALTAERVISSTISVLVLHASCMSGSLKEGGGEVSQWLTVCRVRSS